MILDRDGKEAKHSGENGEGSAQVHFENYKKRNEKSIPSEREEEKHRGTKRIIQTKRGRRREGVRCERGSRRKRRNRPKRR